MVIFVTIFFINIRMILQYLVMNHSSVSHQVDNQIFILFRIIQEFEFITGGFKLYLILIFSINPSPVLDKLPLKSCTLIQKVLLGVVAQLFSAYDKRNSMPHVETSFHIPLNEIKHYYKVLCYIRKDKYYTWLSILCRSSFFSRISLAVEIVSLSFRLHPIKLEIETAIKHHYSIYFNPLTVQVLIIPRKLNIH
jgi:hypothetical protein